MAGPTDRPTARAIGKIETTVHAAELLEKRGVIEIWSETNMYTCTAATSF